VTDETTHQPSPQDRSSFAVDVKCPACGQVGSVIWEENALPSPSGPGRMLILVSGGFHAGETRGHSGDPQIICNNCDAVLED
jgi:ribosomal protein S27E